MSDWMFLLIAYYSLKKQLKTCGNFTVFSSAKG